jgi:hypothetical protein
MLRSMQETISSAAAFSHFNIQQAPRKTLYTGASIKNLAV